MILTHAHYARETKGEEGGGKKYSYFNLVAVQIQRVKIFHYNEVMHSKCYLRSKSTGSAVKSFMSTIVLLLYLNSVW